MSRTIGRMAMPNRQQKMDTFMVYDDRTGRPMVDGEGFVRQVTAWTRKSAKHQARTLVRPSCLHSERTAPMSVTDAMVEAARFAYAEAFKPGSDPMRAALEAAEAAAWSSDMEAAPEDKPVWVVWKGGTMSVSVKYAGVAC